MLSFVALLTLSTTVNAQDIDLGEIELGKTYEFSLYKNYIGTLTPDKDGVVTIESTTSDILLPYYQKLDNMNTEGNQVPFTNNSMFAPRSLDFNVESGKTYYLYANFILNNNTKVTVTMESSQGITLTSSSLDEGSVYQFTNAGSLNYTFNKAVAYDGATLISGNNKINVEGSVFSNSLSINPSKEMFDWLNTGKVKAGDEFTIEITNLRMEANSDIKYGEDGTFTVKYKFCELPITLLSTKNTDKTFLPYYATGDENGIITLNFSGEVGKVNKCELRYGDLDDDASGNFYVETLPVAIDGSSVSVNLQGKRRLPSDMVNNPKGYPTIAIGFIGITDKNGNNPYTTGEGMNSTYWFNMPYEVITADVTCEFSPLSGSNLDNYKSIELWITDENKLSYDGIEFSYKKDGTEKSVIVTNYAKEADTENPGAAILTIPIPEDCKGATDIIVSLHNLTCATGTDYSNIITAKYNAFIIKSATPVNNSTIEGITKGQILKVSTNMNANIGYMPFILRENNFTDSFLMEGEFIKSEEGSNFTYTTTKSVKLLKGHDYILELVAYTSREDFNAGAKPLGIDYITYHGAATPFEFSTVLFESITPAEGTILETGKDIVFTAVFDGMVATDSQLSYIADAKGNKRTFFTNIAAEEPDAMGYANKWNMTIDANMLTELANSSSELILHISAKDSDGKTVEGNTGIGEGSYLQFVYSIDTANGISNMQAESNNNTIHRLDGTTTTAKATSSLPGGLYIINGKKVIIKK